MQDKPLLSRVHDLSAEKCLVFLNKLLLVSKGLEHIYDLAVNRHRTIVVDKASGLLDAAVSDACLIKTALDVKRLQSLEARIVFRKVEIIVFDQNNPPQSSISGILVLKLS